MRRLRAALRAYPRDVRRTGGDVLLGLAQDLIDDGTSSVNREALGLIAGGLSARAQRIARGGWEEGLRRAALPIAAAFLAVACGAVAALLPAAAWPGWSAVAVLGAPALAVFGLLAGRRGPVLAGAAGLVVLGIAQSNSHVQALNLVSSVVWGQPGSGFDVPLLGAAIPGALVLLGAGAAIDPRRAERSTVLATLAWVAAGAVAVRFAISHTGPAATQALTVGDLAFDGVGACMAAYGVAALGALVVGVARRRRDPAGLPAAVLAALTLLPGAAVYVAASLPLDPAPGLAAAALAVTAGTALLVRPVVRAG